MTEEEEFRPYCGAELLPHATYDDGTIAPIICDRPVHQTETRHYAGDMRTSWQWQYADGTWMTVLPH